MPKGPRDCAQKFRERDHDPSLRKSVDEDQINDEVTPDDSGNATSGARCQTKPRRGDEASLDRSFLFFCIFFLLLLLSPPHLEGNLRYLGYRTWKTAWQTQSKRKVKARTRTRPLTGTRRFEYVRNFEQTDSLLPNTWIVVRIDGRAFTKYGTALHLSPRSIALLIPS